MKREERLQKIAQDVYVNTQAQKQLKEEREGLSQEFFRLVDAGLEGRDHILPVKTIEVPDSFWITTGMSKEDFVQSRFPGWSVEHCEKNIALNHTVFVLKRDPAYVPGMVQSVYGDDSIQVSKEIAEYTPEVDWDTLMAERPDLYEELVRHRVVLELDDEALERLSIESPEELATLQRHMRVRQPAIKLQPRKLKNGTKNE